jgi:hypothetical protein
VVMEGNRSLAEEKRNGQGGPQQVLHELMICAYQVIVKE